AGLVVAALLLRLPPRVDGEPADPARLEFLPRDGIRELRRHPALVLLVWALLPLIVTLESVNAVEVFLLRDVFGASAFQFGLGEAATGAGAVVGAFGAGAVHGTRRRILVIVICLSLLPVAQIGQGLAPDFLVFLALGSIVGLTLGLSNALVFTLLLSILADTVRARVLAFVGGASRAMGLIALLLGGTLNATVGPRGAYVVAGVAGLVAVAVAAVRLRPHLRAGAPP
ncbi:MFS transporter, partial [Nostocoides australiense]|nr:MFS transporter [Tetrasphaera australiensis]